MLDNTINMLIKDFNLSRDEVYEGLFMNKIRIHPKYNEKFANFKSNILDDLLFIVKEKFTKSEINFFFVSKLSKNTLTNYGYLV